MNICPADSILIRLVCEFFKLKCFVAIYYIILILWVFINCVFVYYKFYTEINLPNVMCDKNR
jgi:hypothetical protein